MSRKHPVVAVTGSSGSGTSTVKRALESIFLREDVNPVYVEGDAFHRYTRAEMPAQLAAAEAEGRVLSHFGPGGNCFDKLQALFADYGRDGSGYLRRYIHADDALTPEEAARVGEFTQWEPIPKNTDLMFYEGLHGLYVDDDHDIAKHVDLGLGVVPIVNIEWIQKIHRDNTERGYTREETIETILRRMPDYINHIVPQFSRTDINFQRVSTVDTSNPFIARDIPTLNESFVVIRFSDPAKFRIDFPYLLSMLKDSFMSRRNTIVVPGGIMGLAMEVILMPIIHNLMLNR
ncbi:MAG: phosphoribulokinase [Pseudomonadota bacterium]